MADRPLIVSLGERRMVNTGDGRNWSPIDALRSMIADIESGRLDVDMIFIATRTRPNDKGVGYVFRQSGCTTLEAVGLLTQHVQIMLANGAEHANH